MSKKPFIKHRKHPAAVSLKRLFPTFIMAIPHHKLWLSISARLTVFIALVVFLAMNVIQSQNISPLYFNMMNEKKNSVAEYLGIIEHENNFAGELEKYKNIYGNGLLDSINNEKTSRKRLINNFEQILTNSPYSRDILYGLYILYERDGNKKTAYGYFKRAKEVDPNIK